MTNNHPDIYEPPLTKKEQARQRKITEYLTRERDILVTRSVTGLAAVFTVLAGVSFYGDLTHRGDIRRTNCAVHVTKLTGEMPCSPMVTVGGRLVPIEPRLWVDGASALCLLASAAAMFKNSVDLSRRQRKFVNDELKKIEKQKLAI